eukprot:TRINITY_DN208_c1_g1_i1.p1 TRINITY_DN208_c1_g1~~TRINITY_DN208_c1_g1_i1.p1  ORF type:complete len:455 (+),score=60.45 TRINITY_DN208_c1_g1_i1:45-1409(+)
MNNLKKLIIVLLILNFELKYYFCVGSIIYTKNGRGDPINLPTYSFFEKQQLNVTSFILPIGFSAKELSDCKKINSSLNQLMIGAIALLAPGNGCSDYDHIMVAQNAGASGVIIITTTDWLSARLVQKKGEIIKNVKIPVVYMKVSHFQEYLNSTELQQGVIMKMESNKNEIDDLNRGGIVFIQVFLSIAIFISVIFCARKAIMLGRKNILGGIICILCIFANIVDFAFIIDPIGYWRIIDDFNYLIIINLSYLFTYLTFLFVSIYFAMVIVKITNHQVLKYGSWIIFGLISLTEIALEITAMVFLLTNNTSITYQQFAYWRIGMSSIISLFCIIGGIIFLLKISQIASINVRSVNQKNRFKQYIRLGFFVIVLAIIVILISVVNGLSTNSSIINAPRGLVGCVFGSYLLIAFAGIVLEFLLIVNRGIPRSSSSNSLHMFASFASDLNKSRTEDK